ncbi:hypothetical protein [Lignipirellula cremea]|uniref:hypothetical protein n=1 Tax=Lignipirellula cremea TaxID=2528010 RepID=UPI00119E2E5B|nr:hypothetical protein [Lignipirellula cremea]
MGGLGFFRKRQLSVVGGLLFGVEHAIASRSHFIEQLLTVRRAFSRLKVPQMEHPLIGRVGNHIGVGFIAVDSEQPIMVGRLMP